MLGSKPQCDRARRAVPFHDEIDQLERASAAAGPAARVYLRPLALVAGRVATAMITAGDAQPIAGGPLAMTAGEIQFREGGGIRRTVAGLAALRRWLAQGPPAAARIEVLLDRIAAPRSAAPAAPRLMGVVNVTPDSFSDGGRHLDPRAALAHCRALAEDGADILDIGGESTRPGATAVAPAEEVARVQPVLAGLAELRAAFPGLRLSIDTRHAEVMRAALDAGADIINDVTALTGAGSLEVAAGATADIVLMHMQGEPETMNLAPAYDDVALDVFDFLEARIEACCVAGIAGERLIVDPGIGFAKRGRENQQVLRALTLFHGLGCRVLLGLSRKGLGIAKKSLTPGEREPASLAAAYYALSQGVQILRVHDVAATRQVVELWRRLSTSGE